ncbi:mite allergen Der p 3-like [Anabrus simplex]|uniref:mite allergen Der p 3-like n=1 Tax=Anabrus simplex TaxID=316456 RepID=UPI0035A34E60
MTPVSSFLFVALLGMVENTVIPTDDTNNRILGGEDAEITEFPSMARLQRISPNSYCGATIISDRWILTAAHCVDGALPVDITVTVGSKYTMGWFGGSSHQASKIVTHEEYLLKEINGILYDSENDIALVEVEKPFPLNNLTINAARLPLQDEDTTEGTTVTAVGWGRIEGDNFTTVLQKVNLKIVSRQECERNSLLMVDERNLCVADSRREKGICKGDSGGPLFKNDEVVGITSIGLAHCRSFFLIFIPGTTFTKVAYFRHWIKQNTGI